MIITLSLLQHSPPTQEPIDSDAGIFAFGIRLWSAARRIPGALRSRPTRPFPNGRTYERTKG